MLSLVYIPVVHSTFAYFEIYPAIKQVLTGWRSDEYL